jgi:hypothetical protein
VKVNGANSNVWWGCLEVKVENVGQRPLDLTAARLKVSQINPRLGITNPCWIQMMTVFTGPLC